MSDLISRADAIDAVKSLPSTPNGYSDTFDKACIIGLLEELPSADAVPIVYCMDCAKSVPLDEHGALWKCKAHDRTTLRYSYCNNGERKGGDEE